MNQIMKSILTILLTSMTLLCVGQVVTLDIQNPAPRISDGVDVSVSFKKKKIKKNEGSMSADEFRIQFENQLGDGKINFRTELLDTGLVNIGPFKFSIHNTTFTTDIVTIRVFPDLPDVNNGIWLRFVRFGGKDILILEQRVSHDWQTQNSEHSSWSIDAEGVDFSGLDTDRLYALGVELKEVASSTSSNSTQDEILGLGTVSYKLTQYEVTRLKTLQDKVIITKDLFYAFPSDLEIADVAIR